MSKIIPIFSSIIRTSPLLSFPILTQNLIQTGKACWFKEPILVKIDGFWRLLF